MGKRYDRIQMSIDNVSKFSHAVKARVRQRGGGLSTELSQRRGSDRSLNQNLFMDFP